MLILVSARRRRWIIVATDEEVKAAAAVPGVGSYSLALLFAFADLVGGRRSRS